MREQTIFLPDDAVVVAWSYITRKELSRNHPERKLHRLCRVKGEHVRISLEEGLVRYGTLHERKESSVRKSRRPKDVTTPGAHP